MKINQTALEKIIREVIARLYDRPKLLLVYEGPNKPDKLEYLAAKLQDHWQVEVFRAADDNLPKLSGFQQLAFLDVSQDLLVRGAMGLTDTPGSSLLAKSLQQGYPVLFELSDDIQWLVKQDHHPIPDRVNRYRSHIRQYKHQIVEFGVWFGSIDSLHPSQFQYDRKVLTEKDIQDITSTEVQVSANTIITHLARDAARKKGIQIRVHIEGQSSCKSGK